MKTAHRLSLIFIFTFLALLDIPLLSVNFISIISRSSVAAQTTSERQAQADQLLQQGIQQFEQAQYKAAIQYWEQALIIYQQIKDRHGEVNSSNNLGITYLYVGEYQKSVEYFQQSLAISTKIGYLKGQASSLNGLGNIYISWGDYQKAVEYYQQSLAIFTQIGDFKGQANSLMNLGIAYKNLGEYQKAITYYQQSLAIFTKVSDFKGQASIFSNLGNAYLNLGEYQKAIKYLEQSLFIMTDIGDSNGKAAILGNLGNAYSYLGEHQKAIEYFQQSLAISTDIGDLKLRTNAFGNLGVSYLYLGDYQKAIEYFQQSLTISKDIGDRKGQAYFLLNLGIAYYSLGEYQKAINYHQQSLAIEIQIGDREGQGKAFSNIGQLLEKQKQPELAIVFYKQSVNIRESIRFDIRGLDKELQESYTETIEGTYRSLADLLLSQDRIYEAQQVLELLKLQEVQDYTRSRKVRGEMAKVVLLPKEQEIIEKYDQLVLFGQKIANCEQTQCAQLGELRNQRDDLKREYNQDITTLEAAIRNRLAQDDSFLRPQDFNQTANNVIQASDKYNSEKGTVVIYPLILEDKLWILWAAEGKIISKRLISNVGRKQLNEQVVTLRSLLENPNSDLKKLQATSKQLYDWLIKPIEPELKAANIHHLVFSLDRGTRYIPMAVLYDGEKYLIEKYTITTIVSAQLTDTSDRLPANLNDTPILGLGASKAPGYDPLPYVIDEINNIVKDGNPNNQGIYPGQKFLDEGFSFTNLRDHLTGRKLLHIATHGKFEPGSQDRSYLVLGDGEKLNIRQIEVLDDYLDDVHLVVLSACQTALGDSLITDPKQEEGIEINALSFYFLTGGAKTVMASLWNVDDTSTSQLMQRFYCILSQSEGKMTKAEALKIAQLSLLKKEGNQSESCFKSSSINKDFAHPYYWSPFILIGNGL